MAFFCLPDAERPYLSFDLIMDTLHGHLRDPSGRGGIPAAAARARQHYSRALRRCSKCSYGGYVAEPGDKWQSAMQNGRFSHHRPFTATSRYLPGQVNSTLP
eukprot:6210200-Pleurochrysis_carterae.AAC.2